jgi:hypothetical protein
MNLAASESNTTQKDPNFPHDGNIAWSERHVTEILRLEPS